MRAIERGAARAPISNPRLPGRLVVIIRQREDLRIPAVRGTEGATT